MERVWNVKFGNNFTEKCVIAKDVFKAIEKAQSIEEIPKDENWVSKVKCRPNDI